jgi:hypothetical protein
MSYLQIEIGSKLRGVKFNQLAIEIIGTYNNTETATGFLYAMVYGGLMGNTYVKREDLDYTFEQVCDWVDAMDKKDDVVAKLTASLTEANAWKNLIKPQAEIESVEADAEKKKA